MYIPTRELLNTGHLFDWSIQAGFSYEQYVQACNRNNLHELSEDTYTYNVKRYREALQTYLGVNPDVPSIQPNTTDK